VDDAILASRSPAPAGRECKLAAPRFFAFEVIRDATLAVRGPVVYANLVVIIVFCGAVLLQSDKQIRRTLALPHPGGSRPRGGGADRRARFAARMLKARPPRTMPISAGFRE